MHSGCTIIDLAWGTGLEQDEYFLLNPTAKVTGMDLASGMLNRLRKKHSGKDLNLILGLFLMFHLELSNSTYCIGRGLVLFCGWWKIPLYEKLHKSLITNGYFILTDYFALSDKEGTFLRKELLRLKTELNTEDNEFYHYNTLLTVAMKLNVFLAARFS